MFFSVVLAVAVIEGRRGYQYHGGDGKLFPEKLSEFNALSCTRADPNAMLDDTTPGKIDINYHFSLFY